MDGIPGRRIAAVLLAGPFVTVLAGAMALVMTLPPQRAQNGAGVAFYAVVFWIIPTYVIEGLVTLLAYATTSPSPRRRTQVFIIHSIAGLLMGAVLAYLTRGLRAAWCIAVMGAMSGAIAVLGVPDATDAIDPLPPAI